MPETITVYTFRHTCVQGECIDCFTEMGECCEHCPMWVPYKSAKEHYADWGCE